MQLFLHKSLIHSLLYAEYTFCMTLCPPDARVVAKTACALMGKVTVLVLAVLLQEKLPALLQAGSFPRQLAEDDFSPATLHLRAVFEDFRQRSVLSVHGVPSRYVPDPHASP
ncbi:hypothetical protein HMPREF9141_2624 [Prevotella multiformis DSM 16608]|uniref:Uncharacterized protein n=1 Tax=Prevotella multiformis DSM 16608 TaxID=888743 RepID=F0FAK7_9BACT|nr:hypothetical protein HMPREF9141_2624 [Prevotella multiformis DSM 16608]